MKKFFTVQRMSQHEDKLSIDVMHPSTRKHDSFDEAKKEATRLAQQNPSIVFVVFEACGSVIAPTQPVVWDSAESAL
jgi:hypothetical protein